MGQVFHLDVIEAEEAHEPFEFDSEGIMWRVPHVRDLTIGQKLALDRGLAGDLGACVVALRDVAERWDPDLQKYLRDPVQAAALVLGQHEARIGPLLTTWLAAAGMAPGESRASSPTSNVTARPSTPTSRNGTACP
jgi:hypothetical protein